MFEQQPSGIDQQQEDKNRVVQIYDTPRRLNTMYVRYTMYHAVRMISNFFERLESLNKDL